MERRSDEKMNEWHNVHGWISIKWQLGDKTVDHCSYKPVIKLYKRCLQSTEYILNKTWWSENANIGEMHVFACLCEKTKPPSFNRNTDYRWYNRISQHQNDNKNRSFFLEEVGCREREKKHKVVKIYSHWCSLFGSAWEKWCQIKSDFNHLFTIEPFNKKYPD